MRDFRERLAAHGADRAELVQMPHPAAPGPVRPSTERSRRLRLTLLSTAPFYADPLRSFLQYLQRVDRSIRVADLPLNLYRASEELARSPDAAEVTGQLQLPDASRYPVAIRIVPARDSWTALTVDFGGPEVAARLIGPAGSDTAVAWLADALAAGGRMTRADCALLVFEEESGWAARIHLAPGAVRLDRPPLMLWVTSSLAARRAAAYPAAWKVERQWDGALLLIPEPLPARAAAAPSETAPAVERRHH